MPKTRTTRHSAIATGNEVAATVVTRKPRSSAIAKRGVRTGGDILELMSAMITDVVDGTVSAGTANAAINASGKMLKVVELTHRYGVKDSDGRRYLPMLGDE